MSTERSLPLSGIKVLDIAVLFASPFSSTILSDFGAEVIKVEHPTGDPLRAMGKRKKGIGLWFKVVNRNKKFVTLNLSKPEGQALLKELVRDADVVVENFRPGTLEKWGLAYDDLAAVNPRLVMLRVTGFGQDGPYRDKPGFGTMTEALSGFSHMTGFPDGPPVLPPIALIDKITSLVGAFAVTTALYERDAGGSGLGQYIDLNLLEPIFHILGPHVIEYDQLGYVAMRSGNRSPASAPRNCYKTKDGRWLAMSGSTPATAERIMRSVDPALPSDPRFADAQSRRDNSDALDAIIEKWCSERTLAEAMAVFDANEATVAPVYDISQSFEDRHFRAREIITDVPDEDFGFVKMQNVFVKLARTPGRISHAGRRLGADNREIFVERLGKTVEEMRALAEKGILVDTF
jgi:crotonobetainyl-CoA:carnitine CoA-transferase CaiB-like acyl-CoA transferase